MYNFEKLVASSQSTKSSEINIKVEVPNAGNVKISFNKDSEAYICMVFYFKPLTEKLQYRKDGEISPQLLLEVKKKREFIRQSIKQTNELLKFQRNKKVYFQTIRDNLAVNLNSIADSKLSDQFYEDFFFSKINYTPLSSQIKPQKLVLLNQYGRPIKPYRPRTPFSSRNPYSNRRRDEEAQRLKIESMNNGTWNERDYRNAKTVATIIFIILSLVVLYFEIQEIQNRYK